MNVLILATKNCSHRTILEKNLNDLGVKYQTTYVEDDPETMEKYQIQNSPNLILNGEVVFRASPTKSLPSNEELKNYMNR